MARERKADRQVATSCPHCGHASSVQATDTLSPQVCTNCRQIHVATLNVKNVDDSVGPVPAHDNNLQSHPETFLGNIGRYRVSKVLGSGAFGVVYQAWDPRLHRWVAIKVPKLASQRKQVVDDFLREARTAARLRHPRIVSVYDAETASGHPFIVVEFVEGSTLESQLKTGAIAPRRAARIVYELAVALHYAHRKGIVHRDVKPSNVMIDNDGLPRLMDFGLAQLSINLPSLEDGRIAGTPGYMSPEMAKGEHHLAGAASDQYSLGIVLFECLTGRRPFESDGNLMRLLRKVASESPPRARSFNHEIPQELDEICGKMTALASADRFGDMGIIAKLLIAFLKPVADPSIPMPATDGNNRLRITWASLTIAALVVVLSMALFNRPSARDRSSGHELPVMATTQGLRNVPPTNPPSSPAPDADHVGTAEKAANIGIAEVMEERPAKLPENVDDQAPPADALSAIEAARQPDPVPKVEGLQRTFPRPVVAGGPEETKAFRQEFDKLLAAGFPPKGYVDDQAVQMALQHYKKLKQLAPNEPRVPYAMAIVRSRHRPGPDAGKLELPQEASLLLESQLLGGYPFTPGYLSEVDRLLRATSPNIESVRSALMEIARLVSTKAEWPDAPERRRVVIWLGTAYGYYCSGISGRPSHDAVIRKSQDSIEAILPQDLRDAFLASILETQTRIAEDSASGDKKEKAAVAANLELAKQKLAKNLERKEKLSDESKRELKEGEEIEQWFDQETKTIVAEFRKLERTFSELTAQAAPLHVRYHLAMASSQRANTTLAALPANAAANGVPVDPAQLATAQQNALLAEAEMETLRPLLAVIATQADQVVNQAALLEQRATNAVHEYRQKKGKKLEAMAKIQNEIQSLTQSAKGATTQVAKLPTSVKKNRRNIRDVKQWVHWSTNEAWNWLVESLRQSDAKTL